MAPRTLARAGAALAPLAMITLTAVPAFAAGDTVAFDSTKQPLPSSVAGIGFEANGISQLGEEVDLSSGGTLTTVSVVLADAALLADNPSFPGNSTDGTTFSYPLTLTLYQADHTTTPASVGTQIATVTQTMAIPYRPAEDPTCPTSADYGNVRGYKDAAGNCVQTKAFVATFTLPGAVAVPSDLIFGLAFNTTDYGSAPTGATGPYDSLNLSADAPSPSVGTDPQPDIEYAAAPSSYYTTAGGPSGQFRSDTGYTGDKPEVQFGIAASAPAALPETGYVTLLPLGAIAAGGALVVRRQRRKA